MLHQVNHLPHSDSKFDGEIFFVKLWKAINSLKCMEEYNLKSHKAGPKSTFPYAEDIIYSQSGCFKPCTGTLQKIFSLNSKTFHTCKRAFTSRIMRISVELIYYNNCL